MNLARATLAHESRMSGRDVTDMGRKPVARIEGIHPAHRPVADDLGHDRRGRDRCAPLVAVDDGHVLRRGRPEAKPVDETCVCRWREGVERAPKAGEVRSV